MSLEGEVEKLRAQVAKLETGIEPEVISDESPQPERKKTIVDYWHDRFLAHHGMKYAFRPADAVLLFKALALYTPAEKLAWMIDRFLADDDEWVRERGYSVQIFWTKTQGLAFKWVKSVQEPALRQEKLSLEQKLRELEKSPSVISLADRIGGRRA